ncbi:MAG: hypothetical protein KatS3mg119_0062 [Rhodothalassiaceae bacterium]|nr:MAG: hypothetical protein KatS3mg119_0062 [Rhodothalassiaceae bacterium]
MAGARDTALPPPLAESVARLEAAVKAAARARAALAERCRRLEAERDSAEAARRAAEAQAARRIGALEAEIAGLERQLAAARAEIDRLITDLEVLSGEKDA